ncbi:MAG: DUF5012 domain-containing protein [Prevotellaceae bacterium]|nr:DUF5012 domain-containing protein [Prevotellaceae bacterium]
MKKFLIHSLAVCMVALGFVACSDDNDELTDKRVTYYPTVTLEGDDYIILDKGSEFEEPGYSAEMQGKDVTDLVVVTSNVNSNKSGVYSITYSLTNVDGFSSVKKRTIVVLDPNNAIEGFYLTSPDSYREYQGEVAYGYPFEILVLDNGDGTYTVDDLLGGWYCQRVGYGYDYAMEGLISIDDDGTISLLDSYVPGWGDSAEDLEGTYDAATGTLSWAVTYTDYPFIFHVVLNKE